jgi:hypothetical protein
MRGVLEELDCDQSDDCLIKVDKSKVIGDCEDDPDFEFKGRPMKDCDWLKKQQNLDKLCKKKSKGMHVSFSCLVSCGICTPADGTPADDD